MYFTITKWNETYLLIFKAKALSGCFMDMNSTWDMLTWGPYFVHQEGNELWCKSECAEIDTDLPLQKNVTSRATGKEKKIKSLG